MHVSKNEAKEFTNLNNKASEIGQCQERLQ